ncbi:MAG: ABC transporter ATP-binding protein [Bacteroides sp.]|nr:ABC transporter ATP-binding protein [Eubacterium sp.]MCM1417765.1 ABC transporter ATP-binding protein [Roseburia sp.]MCM1461344.1 ABC transporter ATP-binding protein [Bacteroides sp.]
MKNAIKAEGLAKKFKGFTLGGLDFEIPAGFSTALIGANGAGKTTLLDVLCGIIEKSAGAVTYFGSETDVEEVKERIGYCAAQAMFPLTWTLRDVAVSCETAFRGFSREKFAALCEEMGVSSELGKKKKPLMKLSDGNKMRVYLAAVFARETDLLVLDEPGSNLDPLMRDRLCDRFRKYIEDGDGEKTILFSTHNISDMENAADYVIFMSAGRIVERGFTEDLKEKYIMVRDDVATYERVKPLLLTRSKNSTVYSGLALARDREKIEAIGAAAEIPNLQQLSIELLKLSEESEGKERS